MRSNKLQAIELLAQGHSIMECAQEIQVNRRSIHSWLLSPEFMNALETRKREIIESLNVRLIALNEKALDVIEDSLNSRNEIIRLRSASLLLAKYHEAVELSEIEEAIKRINARLDQMEMRK